MKNDRTRPVQLRTGLVSAVLHDGKLRDIRIAGYVALDAVYAAVRDRTWATVIGEVERCEVTHHPDGFTVTFASRHRDGQLDYRWTGNIQGRDGVVRFEMNGAAMSDFDACRIGFCLLHPISLAGRNVAVRGPSSNYNAVFPQRISPRQLFLDITSMSSEIADGVTLNVELDGDLFETEDHRNWTDAGWKTYCTPLRLRTPHRFVEEQQIRQAVTLSPVIAATAVAASTDAASCEVHVTREVTGCLPLLGLGVSPFARLFDGEVTRLRRLRLSHLHVELPTDADWQDVLARASAEAQVVRARLDVAVVTPTATDLTEVAAAMATLGERLGRVSVFDAQTHVTTEGSAAALREALLAHGVAPEVGGGSRAFFAELNRMALPLAELDFITYPITPQVHHFDNKSIMETLLAQPHTLRDAHVLAQSRPVVIGPVTLRTRDLRFVNVAESEDHRPPDLDPRQPDSFTAAYTVGSLAALGGARAITYFQTAGWRGVLPHRGEPPYQREDPAMVFAVWHVLAALAELRDARLLRTDTDPRLAGVLAVAHQTGRLVLLANLGDQPRTMRIRGLTAPQASMITAMAGRATDTVELPAYGVAVVRDDHGVRRG